MDKQQQKVCIRVRKSESTINLLLLRISLNLSGLQFLQGEKELDWIAGYKGSEKWDIFLKNCPNNLDASTKFLFLPLENTGYKK